MPVSLHSARPDLVRRLREAGIDSPAHDARLLIAAAVGLDAAAILASPDRHLTADELERLSGFAGRRVAREPVSRILGHRGFYGLDLQISPATLDPRPDTETLVDVVLGWVRARAEPGWSPRLLDLGTGSGALLLALLAALPSAKGLGTDISSDALAVASQNAARLGLSERASFRVAHWLDGIEGRYDIVVSNPPYIRDDDIASLDPEVSRYDPVSALAGGADGLDCYRQIISRLAVVLGPDAIVAFEIGHDQAEAVGNLLDTHLSPSDRGALRVWSDLAGRPRCVTATTGSGHAEISAWQVGGATIRY